MIWESGPWKDELLKDAALLERWSVKTSRPAARNQIFEKKLFLAAYAIRKLFEAEKVCTVLRDKPILCSSFLRTNSAMTPWNWHRIDEHFNLESPISARLSATALINQIIHSQIFMFQFDDNNHISDLFVSSRQGKSQRLFKISLRDFFDLMREVGNDYPDYSKTVYNPETHQYVTINECRIHRKYTED